MSVTAPPAEAARSPGATVEVFLLEWLAHVRGRVRRVTDEGNEVLVRRHALPALGALELVALRPLQLPDLYRNLLSVGRWRQGRFSTCIWS